MHFFLFDGRSSRDFGIYISGSGTFNAPERDVEKVSIPGRNGDLLIDNGRFKNIEVTYPAFVRRHFSEYVDLAKMWLLSTSGYCRLEDTYHSDYFRIGKFSGPLDFDVRFLNRSGECDISFDCKPQRFLKSGEELFGVENGQRLYNPTNFPALPYFRIYGSSGQLMVGNTIVQISAINDYIEIDCDTQNAYKGTEKCNAYVSHDFPILASGETGIRWEGDIRKVEMKARWWTV